MSTFLGSLEGLRYAAPAGTVGAVAGAQKQRYSTVIAQSPCSERMIQAACSQQRSRAGQSCRIIAVEQERSLPSRLCCKSSQRPKGPSSGMPICTKRIPKFGFFNEESALEKICPERMPWKRISVPYTNLDPSMRLAVPLDCFNIKLRCSSVRAPPRRRRRLPILAGAQRKPVGIAIPGHETSTRDN